MLAVQYSSSKKFFFLKACIYLCVWVGGVGWYAYTWCAYTWCAYTLPGGVRGQHI